MASRPRSEDEEAGPKEGVEKKARSVELPEEPFGVGLTDASLAAHSPPVGEEAPAEAREATEAGPELPSEPSPGLRSVPMPEWSPPEAPRELRQSGATQAIRPPGGKPERDEPDEGAVSGPPLQSPRGGARGDEPYRGERRRRRPRGDSSRTGRQARESDAPEGPPSRDEAAPLAAQEASAASVALGHVVEEETETRSARPASPERASEAAAPPEAADEVAMDIPAWVEPETEDPLGVLPQKGRPELLPAGAGIDPGAEDLAETAEPEPPVHKRILINADDPEEVRIAVLENGRLEELYYERLNEKKYLGNIYKGRIVNLEPAIQAAFVDIGIGRNGFLHVSDVLPAYKDAPAIPIDNLSQRVPDRRRLKIQEILRKGQEILVQISKDAIGAKGPSLTTYVSVPGKYLVLMPGVSRHGISKRIHDGDERSKLRDSLSRLAPPRGVGYIVRTAGRERPQADLERDFQYLMRIWDEVRAGTASAGAPAMLYEETDLVIRTIRDLFGVEVDEILVDSAAVHDRARKFVLDVMPQASGKLRHYTGISPVFVKFGVEEEIEKIYNRRVPLPSGGYIVVEQTEALVAIDVNSGKYRDEEDLEATALKTNLEAAQEIARQLRLRDLGGVIINDFIDMETEANRRAVERALRAALKRDRAKSWISRISRFGIIEMTRQRVRPSFERSNHEPCKQCRGTGFVKSARSLGIAILRQVRSRMAVRRRETCEVVAHPAVVEYLLNERRGDLMDLESKHQKPIVVRTDSSFGPEQFVVRYH